MSTPQLRIAPLPLPQWPELPWEDWADTVNTLHLWTQVIGKIRMASVPPMAHWWHVPLYVTPLGLGTRSMPYGDRAFEIDFNLGRHRLEVHDSRGGRASFPLTSMTVAEFYARCHAALAQLGIKVAIWPRAMEIPETVWLDRDAADRAYDPAHAHALWLALLRADRLLTTFAARFSGRVSPVHFFWGSFDLAVSRFSGRRAPLHPGGVPNCPDWVMAEAYSHEVSSAGWWPGGHGAPPAFYAYHYPMPAGYPTASVEPDVARFDPTSGEFVLRDPDVRAAADPDRLVLDFLESTFVTGATRAEWDLSAMTSPLYPVRLPPRRAWSTALSEPTTHRRHGPARAAVAG